MSASTLDAMPSRPPGIYPAKVNRNLEGEYVPASAYNSNQNRVMGLSVDDVEINVSFDTYERMERDSTIIKSKRIIITNVLADELQFAPGVNETDVTEEEFAKYINIMKFCQRMIAGLETPYRTTLEQLLGNALRYGHGIAEVVWAAETDVVDKEPKVTNSARRGRLSSWMGSWFYSTSAKETETTPAQKALDKTQVRLLPKRIKVKPRNSVRFVIDDFWNVLGFWPMHSKFRTAREIISRDKFIVLTLNKENEDPRGRSFWRAAFNWYNLKTQIPAEMLRYILEEIVPKAVGTLPEETRPYEAQTDDNGNIVFEEDGVTPKMIDMVTSFKNLIERFRSGSGAIVPFGATLEPYKKSTGDFNPFPAILNLIDKQMEHSILLQSLAQSEGEHQARSAAQVHSDLLSILIFWIRWHLAMMSMTDILEVGVKNNFGTEYLKYIPFISLGDFVRRDWAKDLETVSKSYFYGFIDDTQRAELMAWLNMPKPGPSRQEVLAEMDANGEPVMPNKNRPDKTPANKNRNAGNGTEKKDNDTNKNNAVSTINFLGNHRSGPVVAPRNL